ncbi:copper chaperone PCu(A)C [Streptomyces sp. NPDC058655]|uniref:copper chaperone PCu(A)C n=1 Tax=Streptomyces sp. NPDC058655 TaxID=3346577 RepID=UPI00366490F1
MTRTQDPGAADGWRPSRRRLRDGLLSVLAPVIASMTALVGLTAWTTAGAAGSPPRIEVGVGRVLLPSADEGSTPVYFRIVNAGGADDQLLSVTSPAVRAAVLRRHGSDRGAGAASAGTPIASAGVPAGRGLAMTPNTVDVAVTATGRWQVGDALPFVLHFRTSGPVRAVAFVVPPGG